MNPLAQPPLNEKVQQVYNLMLASIIQNYQKIIGCRRLQADEPSPDLAMETDVTYKTTIKA